MDETLIPLEKAATMSLVSQTRGGHQDSVINLANLPKD